MINTETIQKSQTVSEESRSTRKVNLPAIQKRIKAILSLLFRYALIICLSYMILYPLLQMITTALTHPYDIGSTASVWIPEHITLDNIKVATIIMDYPKSLLYSLTSTFVIMLLQLINASFAGYSFARLKFKGSGFLFGLVILTIIVPPTTMMLPQYVYFRNFDLFGIFSFLTGHKLNLLGKPASMCLLAILGQGLNSSLFIYIFRQFFRGLPKELEEAAYVDGAGFLRIFTSIVLPASKPGFITVGVLSFVWNWNDTYFPLLFNPTDRYLRVQLNSLAASSGGSSQIQLAIGNAVSKISPDIVRLSTEPYDKMMLTVCKLLTILPLIIIFLIVQKQFVEGVERSGIVG